MRCTVCVSVSHTPRLLLSPALVIFCCSALRLQFGTFLHDNERLRTLDHIKHTTQSLWTEINSEANAHRFKNGLYGKAGVAKPTHGAAATAAAGVIGAVPNNPSMNLAALSGADLGRAAFLHVVADPRRISIWPYWYRWERRKQNHPVQHAAMVPQAHLHHSSAPAVVHFTLAQQARLTALENTVTAMEQDAVRMDAALRAHAQQEYDAKVAAGQQPSAADALPASFRRIHINTATKIWEGQFAHGHGGHHGPGHHGGKVVPPPPPPQQKKNSGATGSSASASNGGTGSAVRKTRVGSANNRGSIILTDGRQARGSIMNFGGNPLASTSEGADDFAEGIDTESPPAVSAATAGGASSAAASTDSSASASSSSSSVSSSSSSTTTAAPTARLGSGQFPKRVVNPKAKQSSGQVLSGKPLPAASNPRLRQQATLKAQEAKEAMAAAAAAAAGGGTGVTAASSGATAATAGPAATAATPAAAAAPAAAPHGIVHRPRGLSKWNRFVDPASGNPYWHDSITGLTTWNPPTSIPEGSAAAENAGGNGATSTAQPATGATALPVEDFENEADAAAAAAAAAVRATLAASTTA